MNRYGVRARNHWKQHLPTRYSKLDDPDRYFEELGEQVQQRIEELMEAKRQPSTNDFLSNLQALNMSQFEAEAEAMRELALHAPESEASGE